MTAEPLPERAYRPDIQGLRAIAVVLVVLSHVGLGFVSGGYIGVDVFFVVSGFLITGLLLRDHAERGRVRFLDFYARRARRILPAAALTLVVTDIAALLLLNYVRAQQTMTDSIWAAFFAANVRFEQLGTDYFASALPPSPIQHFWSLAVEEQFYLVWPALLAGLLLVARTRRWPLLTAVGLIVALSLGWGIIATQANPPAAYFSALTRAWELGAGAALALGAGQLGRVPAAVRAGLGWAGVVGILLAAVWFTPDTPFPGVAALLPVLGTVLVVAGGTGSATRFGAGALLGLAPFRLVGDVSYSFYLWHWPFLIIPAGMTLTPLSLPVKLGLGGAAFLVSVLTYRFFEDPLRRSKTIWGRRGTWSLTLWPASIAAVTLTALIGLNTISSAILAADHGTTPAPPPGPSETVAAVIAAVDAADSGAPIPAALNPAIPDLAHNNEGFPLPPGCQIAGSESDHNKICPVGDTTSDRTMVVFGDSHAGMWLPALVPIAQSSGWKLIPLIKSSCTAAQWGRADTTECTSWIPWVTSEIVSLKPDVVIIGTQDLGTDWKTGLQATIPKLKASGARVILMGDPQRLGVDPTSCLLSSGATLKTCTFKLDQSHASREADAATLGVDFIPVEQWFCAKHECPTIIDSTITRIDVGHISRPYAVRLQPALAQALALK